MLLDQSHEKSKKDPGDSFRVLVHRAASAASKLAKHAYESASANKQMDDELVPLKCCLMSVSLPWDHIAHDLLHKVSFFMSPECSQIYLAIPSSSMLPFVCHIHLRWSLHGWWTELTRSFLHDKFQNIYKKIRKVIYDDFMCMCGVNLKYKLYRHVIQPSSCSYLIQPTLVIELIKILFDTTCLSPERFMAMYQDTPPLDLWGCNSRSSLPHPGVVKCKTESKWKRDVHVYL